MLFSFNTLILFFNCLEVKSYNLHKKTLQIDFHASQVHFQPFHQTRLIHIIVHLLLCCCSQSEVFLQNKVIPLLFNPSVMEFVPVFSLIKFSDSCASLFSFLSVTNLFWKPSLTPSLSNNDEISILLISQLYSNVLYTIMYC